MSDSALTQLPTSAGPVTGRRAARQAKRAAARGLVADPWLTAEESAAAVGVGLSTWWKHVRLGNFPAPVFPLPHTPRWRQSAVQAVAL